MQGGPRVLAKQSQFEPQGGSLHHIVDNKDEYERNNDPYVDTVYLLSDGHPTAGEKTETEDILRAVGGMNRLKGIQINTISIGTDSELMKKLAERNSGIYRYIK